MPGSLSHHLRERLIGAVAAGMAARAAAEVFGVSPSTGVKWVQRWRRTGSVASKRMGGQKRAPLDAHSDLVLGLVADRPDPTIEEIRAELRVHGIATGRGSVWRFFARHGIGFKKNRARRRAGSAGRSGGAAAVAATSRRA